MTQKESAGKGLPFLSPTLLTPVFAYDGVFPNRGTS